MENFDNYNGIAKLLHWIIAVLIIVNYTLGLTLDQTSWYEIHKQIGLTILFLVFLRIIWRFISTYPTKLYSVSKNEQVAAKTGQIMLYMLMVIIPLSGILLTQIHNRPLNIWGIAILPVLVDNHSPASKHLITEWHLWLANTIIFIAFVHAVIALIHHYVFKDRLLQRMLPIKINKKF